VQTVVLHDALDLDPETVLEEHDGPVEKNFLVRLDFERELLHEHGRHHDHLEARHVLTQAQPRAGPEHGQQVLVGAPHARKLARFRVGSQPTLRLERVGVFKILGVPPTCFF